MKIQKTSAFRLVRFCILLFIILNSSFCLRASGQSTVQFFLTQFTGATNDTTINITARQNPVIYNGQYYWLPANGTNLATTNGFAQTTLIPGQYNVWLAGVAQSWTITVTNSAVPLNAAYLTTSTLIYNGINSLTGSGVTNDGHGNYSVNAAALSGNQFTNIGVVYTGTNWANFNGFNTNHFTGYLTNISGATDIYFSPVNFSSTEPDYLLLANLTNSSDQYRIEAIYQSENNGDTYGVYLGQRGVDAYYVLDTDMQFADGQGDFYFHREESSFGPIDPYYVGNTVPSNTNIDFVYTQNKASFEGVVSWSGNGPLQSYETRWSDGYVANTNNNSCLGCSFNWFVGFAGGSTSAGNGLILKSLKITDLRIANPSVLVIGDSKPLGVASQGGRFADLFANTAVAAGNGDRISHEMIEDLPYNTNRFTPQRVVFTGGANDYGDSDSFTSITNAARAIIAAWNCPVWIIPYIPSPGSVSLATEQPLITFFQTNYPTQCINVMGAWNTSVSNSYVAADNIHMTPAAHLAVANILSPYLGLPVLYDPLVGLSGIPPTALSAGTTFTSVDIPTNTSGTHGYSGYMTNGVFVSTGTY